MSDKKNVLITGASTGFGFDTARALAGRGHTVFATMRGVAGKNSDKAVELSGWAEGNGHTIHILELDVTDDRSVATAIAEAYENGGIDVAINNAGIGNWGIDEGYAVDQAREIFDVNLFGVMRVNHALLPHFRKAGKGLLIYVSSGLGRMIFPFMGAYTSSKFALEAYAEGASYELAPLGIKSVIVQPGAFGTSFLGNVLQPANDLVAEYGPVSGMFQAFGSAFEERARAGELGDPAEVVRVLVEEVERPDGDRPLRRPVGDDVQEPVSTINRTCQEIQEGLMSHFGLK